MQPGTPWCPAQLYHVVLQLHTAATCTTTSLTPAPPPPQVKDFAEGEAKQDGEQGAVDEATQQQKLEVAKQAAAAAEAAVAAAPEAVVPAALKQLEKPEDEKYTVHVPEGLTALDLDIIKLTAQMTARNGKNFLQVGAAAGGGLWWEHAWCCCSDASGGAVGRKHAGPRLLLLLHHVLQAGLVHAVMQPVHSNGTDDGSAGPCSGAASSHGIGMHSHRPSVLAVAPALPEAVPVKHHQLPHRGCAQPCRSQHPACMLPLHPPTSVHHTTPPAPSAPHRTTPQHTTHSPPPPPHPTGPGHP